MYLTRIILPGVNIFESLHKIHRIVLPLTSTTICKRIHLSSSTNNPYGQQNPQLDVFRRNASKWWNGKEFSILRSMNELRVPFIVNGLGRPMSGSNILDVGCGGGILSEPLARLGANVMGIDPVFESINQAQLHAQTDPTLKERLRYRNCNIEDLSSVDEHVEAYDGLIASEVLEHIFDIEKFLQHCTKVLKPDGSLFITTINQTPLSWLGVIFFGEYVLEQLPKGTHTYDMFVNVKGLKVMLERMGYHVKLISGFMYEPLSGNFYWTPTTLTHYALHAVKTNPLARGLNYQQKRYAFKGRKAQAHLRKPMDDEEMMSVIPINQFKVRMRSILNEFRSHLDTSLTTRANTVALETLQIDLDGLNEPLELRDIAQITMKGNLIVINLSTMPEAIKPTVRALNDLGNIVNIQVEVNNIFIPVPRITREHREKLASAARKSASRAKEQMRSLFSEYSSMARANKTGVSIDSVKDTLENIQYLVNIQSKDIDETLKKKIDQLLNQ